MALTAGMHVTPSVRLTRPLGSGGMGAVWVAEHLTLNTTVAVKFLAADRSGQQENVQRFSQEAAAASQVRSPHVVQIYDYGVTVDGQPFIVMEYLEGRDLAEELKARGPLPTKEVVEIVSQLCKALRRAHERGILHRDIKPENVFLCEDSDEDHDIFVKLLDFGIAKYSDEKHVTFETGTGSVVGTPHYMSPEQMLGHKQIDARTDLWSVGVLAYQALTGHRPFKGDSVGALFIAINEAQAKPPCSVNPALPPTFDAWFARACARRPADRFATAAELAQALRLALPESDFGGSNSVVFSSVVRTPTPTMLTSSDAFRSATVNRSVSTPALKRVLVIDDSLTIRKLVEFSFRGAGIAVDVASNGAAGISKATDTHPQVVLLGTNLADMKAGEVCEALLAANVVIPIVLMSSRQQSAGELLAAHANIVDVIPKPFGAPEIVARTRAALAKGVVVAGAREQR